jgi:hypothetical protein
MHPADYASFQPFEGLWLLSKPSGAVACAKVVKRKLLIPYSFGGDGKLTGHYYDCKVHGHTLYCHFEHFDSALNGILYLTPGPNETLKGGRCSGDQISDNVRKDISLWSESLPGIQPVVWISIRDKQTPSWAEKYFLEDWPNKT